MTPHGSRLVSVTNFWLHALVIKLVPCGLLSVFGLLLIYTLRASNRKRLELRRRSTVSVQTAPKVGQWTEWWTHVIV